jgi:hypothetical protein
MYRLRNNDNDQLEVKHRFGFATNFGAQGSAKFSAHFRTHVGTGRAEEATSEPGAQLGTHVGAHFGTPRVQIKLGVLVHLRLVGPVGHKHVRQVKDTARVAAIHEANQVDALGQLLDDALEQVIIEDHANVFEINWHQSFIKAILQQDTEEDVLVYCR